MTNTIAKVFRLHNMSATHALRHTDAILWRSCHGVYATVMSMFHRRDEVAYGWLPLLRHCNPSEVNFVTSDIDPSTIRLARTHVVRLLRRVAPRVTSFLFRGGVPRTCPQVDSKARLGRDDTENLASVRSSLCRRVSVLAPPHDPSTQPKTSRRAQSSREDCLIHNMKYKTGFLDSEAASLTMKWSRNEANARANRLVAWSPDEVFDEGADVDHVGGLCRVGPSRRSRLRSSFASSIPPAHGEGLRGRSSTMHRRNLHTMVCEDGEGGFANPSFTFLLRAFLVKETRAFLVNETQLRGSSPPF